MTHRFRLLRVVETAERLPPALQPPFWGALLGLAVTAVLILASVPLWLFQGRTDVPAAVLDMGLAGLMAGAAGGAIALILAGLRNAGPLGYYALWIIANTGAALIYLGLLRLFGRGEVLGLDRAFAPLIVAGLGALNGLIVARALGRSGRESYGEFRSSANLVAGALLAETADLERRARNNPAAAKDLDQVRQAEPSAAYLRLLERVGRRLEALPAADLDAQHAREHLAELVTRVREDVQRLAVDPEFAAELKHRQEVAEELFQRELEREAKRLRKSGENTPEVKETLGAIERELRGGSSGES
ncbi:MAG: hypothetical protein E4H41_06340 [Gemmatimonadales bacterium]|nr:MAG: hypothetical protein E4H41_06340 [Gemmatimonadales bacterium]